MGGVLHRVIIHDAACSGASPSYFALQLEAEHLSVEIGRVFSQPRQEYVAG